MNSIESLAKAKEHFQTDWDADGVTSVYLPTKFAQDLLIEKGWTCRSWAAREWHGPGEGEGSFWHETDEALQLALAAEVI
jgi:hypothetical protein